MSIFSKELNLNTMYNFDWTTASILKLSSLGFLGLSLIYATKIWFSYGFFKKLGIKTTEYKFLHGNFLEIKEKKYSDCLKEWTKQLGKTYGFYEGHTPILVTSDVEIIQEVFIKQYANFSARKLIAGQIKDDDDNVNVATATKGNWKRMRTIMNPTFSAAKLKEMLPLMKICSDRFIKNLEQLENKDIRISQYILGLTEDTLANSVYGMATNMQLDTNNAFFNHVLQLLQGGLEYNWFIKLHIYFFELNSFILPLIALFGYVFEKLGADIGNPFFWLKRNLFDIVTDRFVKKKTQKDYVQILIEALSENDDKDNHIKYNLSNEERVDFSKMRIIKKMTPDEVTNNLFVFLIAGFDTVYTSLNYCFYCLTKYPEEMKKLQDEIDSHISTDEDFNYDNLNNLKYLGMFVKEVLRLYPITTMFVNRRCTNSCVIKGIKIPANLSVAVDVLSLHNDQQYWGDVDTSEFYPLRFEDESKINPCVYMPFGIGPRICIGMKFALLEINLTLAKVLKNFNVNATPDTPKILELAEGFAVRRPMHDVPVRLIKREF